jgi:hypothetical protein
MAQNGTVSYTNAPGAVGTVWFTGASITYVYNKAPNRGIASILIDGAAWGAIDLYSPTIRWQVSKTYALLPGNHVLQVQVTGQKHRAATDAYVDIDQFIVDIAGAGRGTFDDAAAPITYLGTWTHDTPPGVSWPSASEGTVSYSNGHRSFPTAPTAFTLTFDGDEVTYVYTRAHNRGKAAITIDGVDRPPLDLYAPPSETEWQASTTFSGLGAGVHQLHVSVLPEKNASSSDYFVDIDALLVGRDTRCLPGGPKVIFTYVPPLGSSDNLKGKVCQLDPAGHWIVVYIKVGNSWWVKPYANQALTVIQPDGSWVTDMTTGGNDSAAHELVAYAIRRGYDPPILLGNTTIPPSLEENAVGKISVTREAPPPPYRGPVLAPISSLFNVSLEGWSPGIRFVSDLGNPPGAMEFQELYQSGDTFASAPEKFLGSWAHFDDSAVISFQHRVSRAGIDPGFWGTPLPREIRLTGPAGSAVWTGSAPAFSDNWATVIVPLSPAHWKTSGTWLKLLEQITALEIRVDLFNDLFGAERTQFDNIRLLPSAPFP